MRNHDRLIGSIESARIESGYLHRYAQIDLKTFRIIRGNVNMIPERVAELPELIVGLHHSRISSCYKMRPAKNTLVRYKYSIISLNSGLNDCADTPCYEGVHRGDSVPLMKAAISLFV